MKNKLFIISVGLWLAAVAGLAAERPWTKQMLTHADGDILTTLTVVNDQVRIVVMNIGETERMIDVSRLNSEGLKDLGRIRFSERDEYRFDGYRITGGAADSISSAMFQSKYATLAPNQQVEASLNLAEILAQFGKLKELAPFFADGQVTYQISCVAIWRDIPRKKNLSLNLSGSAHQLTFTLTTEAQIEAERTLLIGVGGRVLRRDLPKKEILLQTDWLTSRLAK